eukprot:TRINITY_DN966_c1_g2_i1.p3 TRINITY_DN966_c1_g2~~TRINITY_DN966_c1_g2_i1.p3  ORF type:complete len:392 (-),score=52.21 TRINITY_DN966_c1_g2_i1:7343-8518(-)
MKQIVMVDLKGQHEKIKDEVNESIQRVICSSSFINGPEVKLFEEELSMKIGGANVVACGNGTDALQIAFMALGLEREDEVLVPVFTYAATVEVLKLLGLKPVFVDVNIENFTIDINDIKDKISKKTKAIIPVHLFGQCADMESVLQIAREFDLLVVEDAAQSIDTTFKFSDGRIAKAGTMGDFGITSFFPSKNLGCYGDGGALFTRHKDLADRARRIANHGQGKKYYHEVVGCNSRLDSIQAAILRVKLKYLEQYTAARRKVAAYYDEVLKDINGIQTPKRMDYSDHVFNQYTLVVDPFSNNEESGRDVVKRILAEYGIPSMIYYPLPLNLQRAYKDDRFPKGSFPVAEMLCKSVLSIPIHTEMRREQLEFITQKLNLAVESCSKRFGRVL